MVGYQGLGYLTDISANVISEATPKGTITNSDLELAGLVLQWLIMEHVCGPLAEKRIALFSNNSPTVSWVQRMACCSSKNIGTTGNSTWRLWEWTLTFRVPTSKSGSDSSPGSQQESELAIMVTENKLKIAQSVARLQPLGRRLRWPVTPILPKS
jgi:hypothetical protein